MLAWISGFSNTAVMVTSRTDIACGHAEHFTVGKLSSAAAVALLRETCNPLSGQWEPVVAQQLAELCDRNALRLVTVGSFIKAGRCTMQVASARSLRQGWEE